MPRINCTLSNSYFSQASFTKGIMEIFEVGIEPSFGYEIVEVVLLGAHQFGFVFEALARRDFTSAPTLDHGAGTAVIGERSKEQVAYVLLGNGTVEITQNCDLFLHSLSHRRSARPMKGPGVSVLFAVGVR